MTSRAVPPSSYTSPQTYATSQYVATERIGRESDSTPLATSSSPHLHRLGGSNPMKGVVVVLIVVAVIVGAVASKGHSSKQASSATSQASVSSCALHGRTVLTGIPSDASQFRFDFIGGGFTGHGWHTDWLPNDSAVKNGTFWIYTLGDGDTTPSGVTAQLQMADGSTVTSDLQECY